MFNVKAEPIANQSPYKRIGIGMDEPQGGDPNIRPLTTAEICENLMKQHEAARIWQEVVSTASGTNAPYQAPSEDCA